MSNNKQKSYIDNLYPTDYNNKNKYKIFKTDIFDNWLSNLKDKQALFAINKRLIRAINGNFGDFKVISSNLFEMRVFIGKGYRVYYTIRNRKVIILICGGHKGTQKKDIKAAKEIMKEIGS